MIPRSHTLTTFYYLLRTIKRRTCIISENYLKSDTLTNFFWRMYDDWSTSILLYLIIPPGESHQINKCLTTIAAAGEEKIPVSGLWRFMRYPFITGELMILASIALTCGKCLQQVLISSALVNNPIIIPPQTQIEPHFSFQPVQHLQG